MDFPAAILLFESNEEFIDTLLFCQASLLDVTDGYLCSWHCILIFNTSDITQILNFVDEVGFFVFFMVG